MPAKAAEIDLIFVPKGVEYQAVCQGLQRVQKRFGLSIPRVQSIPMGPTAVALSLQKWIAATPAYQLPRHVLIMGLCGGLNFSYGLGAPVVYRRCLSTAHPKQSFRCDLTLTNWLTTVFPFAFPVTALTSDRLIWSAQEKQNLAQVTQGDVVDMEGYTVLEILASAEIAVGMLRVVSDDCQYDVPDLTSTIDANGNLRSLPLAVTLLRQPIAASRLIYGSIKSLKVLQNLTTQLFSVEAQ